MEEIKALPSAFLMGTRRIYMNTEIEQKLNQKFIEYQNKRLESARKIQRYYKRKKARESFRNVGLILIQRVRILKKWGNKATKLVFCCFQ